MAAGFVLAFLAQALATGGLAHNVDAAIIGALMLLVPGLLFTNSVRDIIYGDTMSGVNRMVQVLITAVALAVGTGAAVSLARNLWGDLASAGALVQHGLLVQCLAGFVGSLGFCLLFNIHGIGMLLCIAGGIASWLIYQLCSYLGMSDVTGFFLSAAAVSVYAEMMARIRKCPATSFLIVALFPLIPGADIYYTMDFAVRGNTDAFLDSRAYTALAGPGRRHPFGLHRFPDVGRLAASKKKSPQPAAGQIGDRKMRGCLKTQFLQMSFFIKSCKNGAENEKHSFSAP